MLIPLDYRDEPILSQHERIWHAKRPGWTWPVRHPYTSEYAWACRQVLDRVAKPHRQAKIMDAGGGGGSMQHFLAERFGFCWNVDRTPKHLDPSLEPSVLVVADLSRRLPFEDGFFDGIVSASAIEHNPWVVIVEIVRNLLHAMKPGAPLVVTVPAFEWAEYIPPRGWPEPAQATWPECYGFDASSLRALFGAVSDLGGPVEPRTVPGDAEYRAAWRAQHDDMMVNSPEACRYPYLSIGFVLRRRP